MKKTMIALFSISITAGTTYWAYGKLKSSLIRKLIKQWGEQAEKKQVKLDEKTLKDEVNKLYLWDVMLLINYTEKVIQAAPSDQLSKLKEKIEKRKIKQTANLKSLDGIIF
jgi:NTP pyrophosphatase (non-canonical NTP hydrolase)